MASAVRNYVLCDHKGHTRELMLTLRARQSAGAIRDNCLIAVGLRPLEKIR